MSWIFDTNNKVDGQGISGDTSVDKMLYDFITLLTTAGWTITYSSDGSTMQSGNIFTKSTSGATGLGNMGSWFIIKEPAGGNAGKRREFQFQTQTSGSWSRDSLLVVYSAGGFTDADSFGTGNNTTNGTAAAYNHPPIAYDMARSDTGLWTGYTGYGFGDSGATYNLFADNYTFTYHIAAMNSAPYSWYIAITMMTIGNQFPTLSGFLAYDGLNDFDSSEPDPTIFFTNFSNDSTITSSGLRTSEFTAAAYDSARSWYNYRAFTSRLDANTYRGDNSIDTHPHSFANARMLASTDSGCFSCEPIKSTGKTALFPVAYVVNGGVKGKVYKGTSSIFKGSFVKRNMLNTLSKTANRDLITFSPGTGGFLYLPWDGSIPKF